MARTPSNVKGALKSAANTPPAKNDSSLKGLVERMNTEVKRALPSSIDPDRFIRITLTALNTNPKLQECTPNSFLGAMMMAAQLGLEVNSPLGQAYLIPYRNRGVMECQFQLGYHGLLELVYRSGRIKTIEARVVYEKDEFDYSYGLNSNLTHVPYKGQDRGKPMYFYAVWKTIDGGYGFDVMSTKEVEHHRDRFASRNVGPYSPWTKNFESMALKTVLKRALKYAPVSTETLRIVNNDESIKSLPTSPSLIEDVDVMDLPNEFDFEYSSDEEDIELVEEVPDQKQSQQKIEV